MNIGYICRKFLQIWHINYVLAVLSTVMDGFDGTFRTPSRITGMKRCILSSCRLVA